MIANAMEENPSRENIMKVWEVYTIQDAIVVIEKAMKAMEPETINPCWRRLCPDVVRDFTGFTTDPIKDVMKKLWIWKKKKLGSEGFQD